MRKTIPVLCMIHQHTQSPAQIRQLETAMASLYQRHFGSSLRLLPLWLNIPPGQAFVAAQPSRASSVLIPLPDQLGEGARHHFMREFCATWMQITQCNQDQLILVAPDKAEAMALIRANTQRFRPSMRLMSQVNLALRFLGSRLRHGYAQASVNFPY